MKGPNFLDLRCLSGSGTTQRRPVPCPSEPAALPAAGGRKLVLPMPPFPFRRSLFLELVTTLVLQSPNLLLLSFWSPVFSPSASIILRALFFLLIQTKHCLSVMGRALQGSCPQRNDTQSFLCERGPVPAQGDRLRGRAGSGLEGSAPGREDTSVLSLPVTGGHRGPQTQCQSPRAWSVLREEPVCVERGCIKNETGDVVERGISASKASRSVMKHRRTFHS